ncbi:cytochrome c biogenesis protein ResB [bacterium]|nr:cytochrome c biogenesis protein ResB [bacterium]
MSAEPAAAPAPAASPGPLALVGRFLWRELNSLPTAIWVMLALAILNAVGTMIPQVHLAQPPMGLSFDEFMLQKYGDLRYRVIHNFGLDRVYFTWYFNALLIWLCVSAVVCNIVRYRSTVSLWKSPPAARGQSFFANNKRAVFYAAEDGADAALEKAAAELQAQGFRVARGEHSGAACLYADKGFLKKWALVLLHFAILVLLGGGIYGKATGSQGNVRLADGETSVLTLDRSEGKVSYIQPLLKLMAPLNYELDQKNFRIDYDWKIEVPSEMRKNTPEELWPYYRYFVRDYVSDLTGTFKGRTVTKEVKVNHPLVVEKLILYQSGYQQDGYLSVSWAGQEGEAKDYRIIADQLSTLTPMGVAIWDESSSQWLLPQEGGDMVAVLPRGVETSPMNFRFDAVKAGDLYEDGKKTRYIGPLTIASFYDAASGQYMGSQIIDTEKGFSAMAGGRMAECRMSERIDNYSIFQYNRDPGKPVLYFGWICMILGVAFTLYIGFTQVWLRAEDGKVFLLVTGPGGKARHPLRQKLHAILNG